MKPSKTRVYVETAFALLAVAVALGAVARRHWRLRLAGPR